MTDARWRLDGKVAVVTGGTRGIGASVASELRSFGANVLTVARADADICADLTDPSAPARIVSETLARAGRLDILVNNVGTNIRKKSVDYSADDYAKIFDTNLTSAWELCRSSFDALREFEGCVVNIGSVAGSRAVGSGAPYAMTKAALDQLTRYLAAEWAPEKVRVNSVNPWYTNTPLAAPVLGDPVRRAAILAKTPLGRIAEPDDIAAVVAFLCLPAARHVTGQCVAVDGGYLAA